MSETKQVVVITGAGSGIGRATSLKFAANGDNVVLVDFDQQTGEETLKMVKEQGGEGIFVQANVANSEDVQNYVNKTVEAYGRIDVFFNNAGVLQKMALFADIEETELDRILSVKRERCIPWHEIRAEGNGKARQRRHHKHGFDGGYSQ